MKKAVVIPTYWGELNGNENVVFDHPTPIDSEGTLARLLENLTTYKEMKNIPVYIVGISNKEDIREDVEKYLEKYLKPYEDRLKIELYSNSFLMECKNKLGDHRELSYLFDFKGYSQVRNFSLLPVIMNDIDIAIFLDDDEIIEDRDYFKKAVEYVNEDTQYGKVYGKAGYYINGDSYILPTDKIPTWNHGGWNKVIYMNETFKKLVESDERILPTTIALGGNMILSKKIMREICYDVHVNRGEDMDYLFNAKMFNYTILFDNELKITHLPPYNGSLEWKRARSDFYRFKYIRQKLEALKKHTDLTMISTESMMPYPGMFVQNDLENRAKDYTIMLGMHYLSKDDIENYEETMENMKVIYDVEIDNHDLISEYKKQRQDWKTIISVLFK